MALPIPKTSSNRDKYNRKKKTTEGRGSSDQTAAAPPFAASSDGYQLNQFPAPSNSPSYYGAAWQFFPPFAHGSAEAEGGATGAASSSSSSSANAAAASSSHAVGATTSATATGARGAGGSSRGERSSTGPPAPSGIEGPTKEREREEEGIGDRVGAAPLVEECPEMLDPYEAYDPYDFDAALLSASPEYLKRSAKEHAEEFGRSVIFPTPFVQGATKCEQYHPSYRYRGLGPDSTGALLEFSGLTPLARFELAECVRVRNAYISEGAWSSKRERTWRRRLRQELFFRWEKDPLPEEEEEDCEPVYSLVGGDIGAVEEPIERYLSRKLQDFAVIPRPLPVDLQARCDAYNLNTGTALPLADYGRLWSAIETQKETARLSRIVLESRVVLAFDPSRGVASGPHPTQRFRPQHPAPGQETCSDFVAASFGAEGESDSQLCAVGGYCEEFSSWGNDPLRRRLEAAGTVSDSAAAPAASSSKPNDSPSPSHQERPSRAESAAPGTGDAEAGAEPPEDGSAALQAQELLESMDLPEPPARKAQDLPDSLASGGLESIADSWPAPESVAALLSSERRKGDFSVSERYAELLLRLKGWVSGAARNISETESDNDKKKLRSKCLSIAEKARRTRDQVKQAHKRYWPGAEAIGDSDPCSVPPLSSMAGGDAEAPGTEKANTKGQKRAQQAKNKPKLSPIQEGNEGEGSGDDLGDGGEVWAGGKTAKTKRKAEKGAAAEESGRGSKRKKQEQA